MVPGIGGTDGEIAIDLVNLQGFSMNETSWHATIGAGMRLGELDTKLHDAGARAIAHGVCPGVGIGGHATIVSPYPTLFPPRGSAVGRS